MLTVIALLIVGTLLYRVSTPASRSQMIHTAIDPIRRADQRDRALLAPFRAALRERTPHVPATLTLALVHGVVFAAMVFGRGTLNDPSTLIGWGASVGPRTTNGEWWRLLTAPFVNSGIIGVAIRTAALVQIGSMLERIVGPLAFGATYAAAALCAGLITLTVDPTGVTYGASGALFGLYGAFGVSVLRSWRDRSRPPVPLAAVRRTAIVAAALVLYEMIGGGIAPRSAFGAAIVGALFTWLFVDVTDALPSARRVAVGAMAVLVAAAAAAVPLRGIADVTPEIARLTTIERRTAGLYESTSAAFRRGATTAAALAHVIEASIVPELQAADDRLQALTGVPHDDRQRVHDAREYLRLRSESWRLRAKALRESTAPAGNEAADGRDAAAAFRANAALRYRTLMLTLGRAEMTERAALETLDRVTR